MTTSIPADPTGRRFRLVSPDGRVAAQVAQVGASLRSLEVGGRALIPPYPDDVPTPSASGITLVPWPNRIRDGRWTQRGETRQLPITEPKTGSASHGLLRFMPYQPTDAAADMSAVTGGPAAAAESAAASSITLAATVFPQTGYPFHLETSVQYTATSDGIAATHRLTNVGREDAPVALGIHPYFCLGGVDTADLALTVPAASFFELDERLLPVAERPVDAGNDLRSPRRVGDLDLNVAYGELTRDADDRVRCVLEAPDGQRVTLWLGAGFDHVQVFTMNTYPGQDLALALEPMTAPPDAFNSGQHLRWLTPGETWELNWGVEHTPSTDHV
ncbi:aldose 1-epimerase family protein [Microbacterium sp. 1P10UB]|uniref:aldose 1-epimerase family protein n=1 Tax=unclassified Microbacterium TaxID=2609290 RepID=UPI0039A18A3D